MKRPEAPCLFCCARHLGCHTNCKPYNEYEHAQKKYREHITQQRIEEDRLEELELKRFRR